MDIELDAYFARIAWRDDVRIDLDSLAKLLRAHMRSIPFENLDVLAGRGVDLDLRALQHKLVASHRGGYCFEHATLFAAVLEALGFAPTCHAARVVLRVPRTESARTHMFVTVPLPEGTFVVDPGFGSLAPTVPVPLVDATTSPAHNGSHWLGRNGADWVLRARRNDAIVDCWVSTLEDENDIDFVVANHYVATHPDSGFRQRLMLRALTPHGSVSVMNRDVTFREGGRERSEQLADRKALRALLRQHFGFDFPEAETLVIPSLEGWH